MNANLPSRVFEELARFESSAVANAVDSFRVRLLNEGFSGQGIACRTHLQPPMVGVAVTLKVRSADPPMKRGFYLEHGDWWERLEEAPFPRVLAIEDTDANLGRGSLVGPVHACILKALGFVGIVTTGALRGTHRMSHIGLHAYSGNLAPAHAYGHVVEMGGPVAIAGMRMAPGDIVHGDADGIVTVPADLAPQVPEVARQFVERERRICEFCASPEYSREKLRNIVSEDRSRW